MTPAEEAAYLAGATWGINAGRRQVAHETHTNDQRDEWIARMIVAQLLQHDHNGQLAAWVTSMKPYAQRGIPRVIQDNPVPHDLWPVGNPADWTDEPTPDPT